MLIGAALSSLVLLAEPDKRHLDEGYRDNDDAIHPVSISSVDWDSAWEFLGFVSLWWPARSTLMGGSGDGLAGDNLLAQEALHSDMICSLGANGRLGFVGITRNAYGSPLANCTVRCFRTSTDELVSKVTSDANGFYIATTPYSDGHYLVVHGSSGPEVAGASVSTILPA